MIVRAALAASLLLAGGCVSNFVNWAKVSSGEIEDTRQRLFAVAQAVAQTHGLTPDTGASDPPVRQGYYGRKYHYYTFESIELDGKLVAAFVHEARMTSRAEKGSEPVRDFVERVESSFDPAAVKVETGLSSPPPTQKK